MINLKMMPCQEKMKKELLEILKILVETPTLSGEEEKVERFLKEELSSSGFKVKKVKKGEVFYLHAWRGNSTLIISAHLDVFPLYNFSNGFQLAGEKIVKGRGVLDVKGQISALLLALRRTSYPCQIIFTTWEERTGKGSEIVDVEGEGCLVLEPTEFTICTSQAGSIEVEFLVEGRTSHGSLPWKGENAIERAFLFYQKLQNLPSLSVTHPHFPKGGWLTLGRIEGGWEVMVTPDWCKMEVEVSFPPSVKIEKVKREIERSAKEEKVKYQWKDFSPPYEIDSRKKVVVLLKNAVKRILGKEPKMKGIECWTDAENFVKKGIPTVVFGAGPLYLAHTERERIKIEKLLLLTQILEEFLKEWENTT